MPKILFINNVPDHCGVQQYGLNTWKILSKSKNLEMQYAECNTWDEAKLQIGKNNPYIVLYNYHPTTLPWFLDLNLNTMKDVKHVAIIHEPNLSRPKALHSIIQQSDMPRILFECDDRYVENEIPTIGSFGFGAWHKGFHHLVVRVQKEYDNAIIRFNMPSAFYGDPKVSGAIAEKCRKEITKPGIKLEVSYDFMTQEKLVAWLNMNTINVFHYEKLNGCGNSSALDQALSCRRPIGITKSFMFRHIVTTPSIFIEDLSLKQIISNGIEPLIPYYEKWSNKNFIKAYEEILLKIN